MLCASEIEMQSLRKGVAGNTFFFDNDGRKKLKKETKRNFTEFLLLLLRRC